MTITVTIEDLFDLVAPIFIYHATDVCFRRKAQAALRKLQRLDLKGSPIKPLPELIEDQDLDDLYGWATAAYDTLFKAIVDDKVDGWKWNYDSSGAKAYFDDEGDVVMAGDKMYHFPYYETAGLLRERIHYHIVGKHE